MGIGILILALAQLPGPPPGPGTAGAPASLAALERAAQEYAALAARGGWETLAPDQPLRPGDRGGAVTALRRRLAREGYPVPEVTAPEVFDFTLENVVRRFQELHGLVPDGVVGRSTLAALNVSAQARADQLAANLARERTLPALEPRHLLVNIPAFTLELVEAGRPRLRLRVIVGRRDWPTPSLSSRVEEVVFAPLWIIPRSIALEEILPLARKDPAYFQRTGTRVFEPPDRGGGEIDPAAVDWIRMTPDRFAYQLVQEPGPLNPLGGVKLVFPSPYTVYLHDTPARELFTRTRRTFSHGCVRVEGIAQLVQYLLPDWSPDSIRIAMSTGRNRRVRVADPIPIHLVYRTAWIETDGLVAFRDDVYGRDRRRRCRRSPKKNSFDSQSGFAEGRRDSEG
jgi:murein L,D-transpeptidase YcbB/YkuD